MLEIMSKLQASGLEHRYPHRASEPPPGTPSGLTLSETAEALSVSQKLVQKMLRTGRLKGTKTHKWSIPAEQVLSLKKRRERLKGWPRLVDVARHLGIHRNQGEAICRRAGLPVEKDFADDCRIPPKAVALLASRVKKFRERADWIRLQDFAAQMGLPSNVIGNGMRMMKLKSGHDLSGQVIFPEETRQKLIEWRASVAERRKSIRVRNDQKLYKLRRTAEESAAFFATPGTPEHATKARALKARYQFWAQRGLPSVRMGRARFFTEEIHHALLDEISVSEASEFAGVSVATIKGWGQMKMLPTLAAAPTRRSYSRAGLVALLRDRYRNSAKLMRRSHVPARLLPPWSALIDELRTSREVLSDCLRLLGSADQEDLDALGRGHGFIQRDVWLILERWRGELAEGRRPTWTVPTCTAEPLPTEQVTAEAFVQVLSFLCAVPPEHFEPVKRVPFKQPFTFRKLGEICRMVSAYERCPRIYGSHSSFQVQDVLLDPWAHDIGTVNRVVDHRMMLVRWFRRGELRMAQCPHE